MCVSVSEPVSVRCAAGEAFGMCVGSLVLFAEWHWLMWGCINTGYAFQPLQNFYTICCFTPRGKDNMAYSRSRHCQGKKQQW